MKAPFRFLGSAFADLPGAVWMLALVSLINRAGTMVLPFLPLYTSDELGYGVAFAGIAVAYYGAGSLIGTWWGGWLSDRVGSYNVLIFHLLGCGLMMFALPLLVRKPLLLGGLFLLGFVAEAIRPPIGVMVASACPEEKRPQAFTLIRLAINLGMAVGPAVGGFLAMTSYLWLFRIDGITCLLAILPLLLMPHGKNVRHQEKTREKGGGAPAWRDLPFLLLIGTLVVAAAMILQIWSTYPIYLKLDYGLPESAYGLLMSGNGLIIICSEMSLTQYFSRFRPMRVVVLGCGLFAIGLGMLPLGNSIAFAIVSLLFWTLGEMLMAPFLSTEVANRAPKAQLGSYMGLYNMGWASAFLLGPLLGTAVYDAWGGTILWLIAGGTGLCCMLAFSRLDHGAKNRPKSPPKQTHLNEIP